MLAAWKPKARFKKPCENKCLVVVFHGAIWSLFFLLLRCRAAIISNDSHSSRLKLLGQCRII